MATTHGRKLACDLILTHFGDIVHKVCRCLVNGGPLSIGDIGRLAEVNPLEVENSIVVLLQHNCVQGFKAQQQEDGAIATLPPQVPTSYIAICDNILHRMRFPKFVAMVRDDLGEEAEILIEELLEHGRLTLEQIIQRGAAVAGKAVQVITKELKETFEVLLQAHYIERCPSSEPVLPWTSAPESSQKCANMLLACLGEPHLAIHETISEEQRNVTAAAALSIERFQMPTSTDDLAGLAMDKEVDETFHMTTNVLHMDAETSTTITEKDILWRVNFEEFVRRLRHQACVRLVQSRVNIGAGIVLAALLDATRMHESSAQEQYSATLSMESIIETVQSSPRGQHMTLERIQEIVQQLEADSSGYFSRSCESSGPMERDNSYLINMRKIIELCQRIEVEGIILQHFGRDCCRIFQLLAMKGQLEQKQIGERAMVPTNVEELLRRLLKDQYVQVQEIAKRAEQTARKSKYFWRVNYEGVQHRVLDDLYCAAVSICSRLADEHKKEQEMCGGMKHQQVHTERDLYQFWTGIQVLGFTQQVQEIANEGAHAQVPGTPEEQVKDNHQFTTILENSLSKVDDAILLFHDF